MPTNNPKISLYVPKHIYNRFKEFQEEQSLSMSQAGIVILAEYFGLKETIKEITEGTTIGGVTLERVEEIEKRLIKLEILEARLSQLEDRVVRTKTTSEPKVTKLKNQQEKVQKSQFELLPDLKPSSISISTTLLAQRLDVKPNSVSSVKSKKGIDGFYEWSKGKDFDQIGWIPESKTTYTTHDKLSDNVLTKLQKWIKSNS